MTRLDNSGNSAHLCRVPKEATRMASAIEYAVIAALVAIVVVIALNTWSFYDVSGALHVTKMRPAITEPARP